MVDEVKAFVVNVEAEGDADVYLEFILEASTSIDFTGEPSSDVFLAGPNRPGLPFACTFNLKETLEKLWKS